MRSVIWFVSYIRPCLQESVLKFLHAGPFVKTISRILLSCSCREFWTPFASPGALPCPLDTLTYSAPLCPTAEPQTLREGSPYSRAAKVLVSGAQRGKYFPKEETAQDGQCSWTITSEITLEDIVCRMGFCRLHLCVILWKPLFLWKNHLQMLLPILKYKITFVFLNSTLFFPLSVPENFTANNIVNNKKKKFKWLQHQHKLWFRVPPAWKISFILLPFPYCSFVPIPGFRLFLALVHQEVCLSQTAWSDTAAP